MSDIDDIKVVIGSNLRKFRELRGLSQTELAHQVGLKTYAEISRYESGKGNLDMDRAKSLAKVLDIKPELIFDFKNKPIQLIVRDPSEEEVVSYIRSAINAKRQLEFYKKTTHNDDILKTQYGKFIEKNRERVMLFLESLSQLPESQFKTFIDTNLPVIDQLLKEDPSSEEESS